MVRYAITAGGDLLANTHRWAAAEVEYIQLREKQMESAEIVAVAAAMMRILSEHGNRTRLLISRRADVAAAAGAGGVHLTAQPGELTPAQVRRILPGAMVSISCHTPDEVERARDAGADLILFGPVFEKRLQGEVVVAGVGLDALRAACAAAGTVPLLALGGVGADDVERCLQAGAAGIAGIRMFA
jgi:thiamine-phosphate pyrophosphorylase